MKRFKTTQSEPRQTRPLEAVEFLTNYLSAYGNKRGRLPGPMPPQPREAAQWWISLQEKPDETCERPHQVPVQGEDGAFRWIQPYNERLIFTLRKFMRFSFRDREFIIGCVKGGCPWRGDDIDFYRKVAAETIKFRSMDRDQQKEYMRQQIGKMQSMGL